MNDMVKALQTLKDGCNEIADCAECPIELLCAREFYVHEPLNWDIPEVKEEPEEDEDTSIVVVRERLDRLLDTVNKMTEAYCDCSLCPLPEKIKCNGGDCQGTLLAWLQDQPII